LAETHERLLAIIREAQHGGTEGTVTPTEIMKLLECGRPKALRIVHELVEAGRLEPTKVKRANIQGHVQPVGGYKIVEADDAGGD